MPINHHYIITVISEMNKVKTIKNKEINQVYVCNIINIVI